MTNTIKFLGANPSNFNQPQYVKLTTNGKTEMLTFAKYTRYYDSADKQYNSFKKFTKINNRIYV